MAQQDNDQYLLSQQFCSASSCAILDFGSGSSFHHYFSTTSLFYFFVPSHLSSLLVLCIGIPAAHRCPSYSLRVSCLL